MTVAEAKRGEGYRTRKPDIRKIDELKRKPRSVVVSVPSGFFRTEVTLEMLDQTQCARLLKGHDYPVSYNLHGHACHREWNYTIPPRVIA